MPGESATIGRRENVFAVRKYWSSSDQVRISASGENHDLLPGDFVDFDDGEATIRVFYKQAEKRSDGRLGFDVVPVESTSAS